MNTHTKAIVVSCCIATELRPHTHGSFSLVCRLGSLWCHLARLLRNERVAKWPPHRRKAGDPRLPCPPPPDGEGHGKAQKGTSFWWRIFVFMESSRLWITNS
ncbi:hypothetical protein NP493_273g03032 [Ridgeia piscesae]|uniref:Uncharacterized protein n=1 Tax=Ridgeia piscesae TaxID=27915 RepID=A0AAD9UCD8_RIDPI|nr:hypothetical protein NP493_273g03032 [Ridgeia piscesae]